MAKVYSVVALTLWMVWCTVGQEPAECRGRPHLMLPFNECCNINLDPGQIECLQKIREKWMAKKQSSDKDMSDVGCASDCVFTTEIITSDNEINTEKVKESLDTILGDEWQSLSPTMIETCTNRAKRGPGRKGPIGNCNAVKEKFLFCLHEQVFVHCPDSAWKNGEECNNARSYLQNCPFENRHGRKGHHEEEV